MDPKILTAILDTIEGDTSHGGFVQAMAERDYGLAAFRADAHNGLTFCELVKWREWVLQYGMAWARAEIAAVEIAAGIGRDRVSRQ